MLSISDALFFNVLVNDNTIAKVLMIEANTHMQINEGWEWKETEHGRQLVRKKLKAD